jgi:hypothetical protein
MRISGKNSKPHRNKSGTERFFYYANIIYYVKLWQTKTRLVVCQTGGASDLDGGLPLDKE